MTKRSIRNWIKVRAGSLCLVGIFSATFMHTSKFMSHFFYESLIAGIVAALAIDLGVIAMSLQRDEMAKSGELAVTVRIVTGLVLLGSGVANIYEGFLSLYGKTISLPALMELDIVEWLVLGSGTALFSVLAYVTTGSIGANDIQQVVNDYIPKQEKPVKREGFKNAGDNARRAKAARRKEALVDVMRWHPEETTSRGLLDLFNDYYPELAVGSHTTIDRYMKALKKENKISVNGTVVVNE